MATFLGSSPAFLARPIAAKPHLSCAQSSRPPSAQQPPEQQPPPQQQQQPMQAQPQARPRRAPAASSGVDSTDWVASSLTRRFGIGAGLAWVGFLAFGVVSEQLKTRFEVAQQLANTKSVSDVEQEQEVVLPNGIRLARICICICTIAKHCTLWLYGALTLCSCRYYEMRVGGGDVPRPGDLVVIDLKGRVAGGETFVDTFGDGKRPLALVMGSRPYTRGMCEGVEYVLRSMRAGGKRRVVVPPALGFGDDGADFGDAGEQVPPGATLEYVVEVDKVSIAPA
uniref:peptidylprolyl isomerase n=1 Tax=Oryza punctata TaxID=4537 RepID=A0A0E0KI20_ORYPU